MASRYDFSLTGPRDEFVARIESGTFQQWLDTLCPRLKWIAQKRHAAHLRWQALSSRRHARRPDVLLVWLDRHGLEHTMPMNYLPPTRTSIEWQQVYEYSFGCPSWLV